MGGYRPVGTLRDRKYVTVAEASELVGGVLSPGMIRDLVKAGQVPGAIRAGRRYFVLRRTVSELIVDMSNGVPSATVPRRGYIANTFDAMRAS